MITTSSVLKKLTLFTALLLFPYATTCAAQKESDLQVFEPSNARRCAQLFREQKWTPLEIYQAFLSAYCDALQELLNCRNTQVDSTKENNDSLQHDEIKPNHSDIITFLKNTDIRLKLKNNKGTEDILVLGKNLNPLNFLSKYVHLGNIIRNSQNLSLLHFAALTNRLDVVKLLVSLSPGGVNAQSRRKITPLHLAARQGLLKTVQFLLNSGANKDARDDEGNSVLHFAAAGGQFTVVTFLVAGKVAALDLKNRFGQTPLNVAARYGQLKTLQFLLASGANKDARDNQGNSILHYAAQYGHYALLEFLLKNDITGINSINRAHQTPLDVAIKYNKLEAACILLRAGALYGQQHIQQIVHHPYFKYSIWGLLPHIFSQSEERQLQWHYALHMGTLRKINNTHNWTQTEEGRAHMLISLLPCMNQQPIPYFNEVRRLLSKHVPQDLVRHLCKFTGIPWRHVDKESRGNKRSLDEVVVSPPNTKKQRVV